MLLVEDVRQKEQEEQQKAEQLRWEQRGKFDSVLIRPKGIKKTVNPNPNPNPDLHPNPP